MVTGINVFETHEVNSVYWAVKNGVYPYGVTGTLATGSGGSMGRAEGFVNMDLTVPEAEVIAQVADGKVFSVYRGQPTDVITAQQAFLLLDQELNIETDDRSLWTVNNDEYMALSNRCLEYQKFAWVINMRAVDRSGTTSDGTREWYVIEILDAEAQYIAPGISGTSFEAAQHNYSVSLDEPSKTLWGEDITQANTGKQQAYAFGYWSDYPVYYHTFIGDGTTTTTTLDTAPFEDSADATQVWEDGTEQTYSTDFSTSGTTLTFTAAPASDSVNIVRVKFDGAC